MITHIIDHSCWAWQPISKDVPWKTWGILCRMYGCSRCSILCLAPFCLFKGNAESSDFITAASKLCHLYLQHWSVIHSTNCPQEMSVENAFKVMTQNCQKTYTYNHLLYLQDDQQCQTMQKSTSWHAMYSAYVPPWHALISSVTTVKFLVLCMIVSVPDDGKHCHRLQVEGLYQDKINSQTSSDHVSTLYQDFLSESKWPWNVVQS